MIVCDTNILSTCARVGILELLFKLFPKLEGVVICARRNSIFLTNDKRVRNYCQEHGIEVYDLALLLRTFWRKGVVSRKEVQKIVSDIERLERMVFKNKQGIFHR